MLFNFGQAPCVLSVDIDAAPVLPEGCLFVEKFKSGAAAREAGSARGMHGSNVHA